MIMPARHPPSTLQMALVISLALGGLSVAHAQTPPPAPSSGYSDNGSGKIAADPANCQTMDDLQEQMTQAGMNICAAALLKQADAGFNKAYRIALERLGGRHSNSGKALIEAQRAWISFRDLNCKARASIFEGGSMQPLEQGLCLGEMTRRRTKEIRAYTAPN